MFLRSKLVSSLRSCLGTQHQDGRDARCSLRLALEPGANQAEGDTQSSRRPVTSSSEPTVRLCSCARGQQLPWLSSFSTWLFRILHCFLMLFVSCSLTVSQERPHPLSLLGSPASSSISEMTYSPGEQKERGATYNGLTPGRLRQSLHPLPSTL